MIDHEVAARIAVANGIEALVTDGFVLMLGRDADGDAFRDYTGEAWNGTIRRRAAASSLAGVVADLGEHPPMKLCLKCGPEKGYKRLWAFGPDKDSADGRAGSCKDCEKKRIGAHARRKKGGETK